MFQMIRDLRDVSRMVHEALTPVATITKETSMNPSLVIARQNLIDIAVEMYGPQVVKERLVPLIQDDNCKELWIPYLLEQPLPPALLGRLAGIVSATLPDDVIADAKDFMVECMANRGIDGIESAIEEVTDSDTSLEQFMEELVYLWTDAVTSIRWRDWNETERNEGWSIVAHILAVYLQDMENNEG